MSLQLYMPNGQTIEEYINQQVNERFEERLIQHLSENLTLSVHTDWYSPQTKEIKIHYKDTLICWDSLNIPE